MITVIKGFWEVTYTQTPLSSCPDPVLPLRMLSSSGQRELRPINESHSDYTWTSARR